MNKDVAYWLLMYAQQIEDQNGPHHLSVGMREGADEIKRLRAALREIAKNTYGWEPGVWTEEEGRKYFAALFFDAQKTARAALKTPTEAAQPRMERSDND